MSSKSQPEPRAKKTCSVQDLLAGLAGERRRGFLFNKKWGQDSARVTAAIERAHPGQLPPSLVRPPAL